MPAEGVTARSLRHLPVLVVAAWVVLLSGFVLVGSDLLWVVSVGDAIRSAGQLPDRLPNLVAPQADWQNPVVLAELLLSWVNAAGWAALPAMHLLVVAAALLLVVLDGRRAGAGPVRMAGAVSLVVVGAAAPLVVVRFPSLSLVPFVALVALLRAWERSPGRLLWAVPPLMVLWGNLHGAVLVGLAVLGVFVVAAGRHQFGTRAAVGVASLAALLVTSAGFGTPSYYVNALGNEAAVRGTDLWARPSLSSPLDIALVVAAALLLVMAARSLRRWEWLVAAGLVLGTLTAARHGVWLLLFLAPIAGVRAGTRGREGSGRRTRVRVESRRAVAAVGVAAVVAGAVGLQLVKRQSEVRPPGHELVDRLRSLAGTGTVLAVEPAAETFAQRGIHVWAANPIDAFPKETQAAFLDFLHDCTVPDVPLDVVVVEPHCVDELMGQGWGAVDRSASLVVLTRDVAAG